MAIRCRDCKGKGCETCDDFGVLYRCPKCKYTANCGGFDYGGSEPRHCFCIKCNTEFSMDTGRRYTGGVEKSKSRFWQPDQEAMGLR